MEIKASGIVEPRAQHKNARWQIQITHTFYFKNLFEILFGQLEESGGLLFLHFCSISLSSSMLRFLYFYNDYIIWLFVIT